MKHPLLLIIVGIIFLSSCVNVIYLFPQSDAMRNQAIRASINDAPEAVPGYLQAVENVSGYQFSLTLTCFVGSMFLLIYLFMKDRKANVD